MTGRRLLVSRRWSDGQAMVHANPDRPYWAWPMLLRGEPLILPRGHSVAPVTFYGDGFMQAVGQSFIEFSIGDLDPASERQQAAYELGLRAKRRLGDDELRRKDWSDEEVWAYQQGLKDRPDTLYTDDELRRKGWNDDEIATYQEGLKERS